ncbi:unnamed protein product [Durusdinium trenchii]|uniref:Centrosomal protein of 120 kDa n=1 Tax=Durusdinium trenchii TaxID=1381693 RepID=A0ABP0IFP1_9DINO
MVRIAPCSVAVLIKVNAAATLLPPPDGTSQRWMKKLWSALKPQGSFGSWAAILQGSLAEVCSHLWHHQALFFEVGDEHLEVPFSELLDPSTDFANAGRYAREVSLQEEQFLGSGGGSSAIISLELIDLAKETVPEGLGTEPPSQAFVLDLQLHEGAVLCAKDLLREARTADSQLQLRFDSVEAPLSLSNSSRLEKELPGVKYLFPLVDCWEELQEALSDLHVYLQIPDETCDLEVPVDLSALLAASQEVAVEVRSAPVKCLDTGLPFRATLSRAHMEPEQVHLALEVPQDLGIWERGARLLAVGPRHWRLSIEIRSARLTERAANAFVSYNYPPLRQVRPFRTNPPNLLRKKATVSMPHSFAAYCLTSTLEDLQARLEEPLYLEVWHRDLYRKDSVVGIAEADLSMLTQRPLESSSNLPSMVESFQALDQVCPIIDSDIESQVGTLRVVIFLEDLGLATVAKPSDPVGPAAVSAVKPQVIKTSAVEEAAPLKGAYELEMWRQAEEEKFRVYLQEQEQELIERLEEEFRQKEEARASEFMQRKVKLEEVEATVRRKLQDLQEREMAVVAEETRVATLQEEVKRRMGMAVAEHEDASKRQAMEAQHSLELARQKSQFLDEQRKQLEVQLEGDQAKLKALQLEQLEQRRAAAQAARGPSTELKEELQATRLQLREQQLRNEAIAASRDHFKEKVEELCGRLMATARPLEVPTPLAALSRSELSSNPLDLTAALRQVQEDLAKLADTWTETPKRTPTDHVPDPLSSTQRQRPQRVRSEEEPKDTERHLAWLRSQRHELLDSGLYGSGDRVLMALDIKIAQAEARLS